MRLCIPPPSAPAAARGGGANAARKPGESNPCDVGQNGVARYFRVVQNCTMAAKLRAARM
jgi:hypothetical protein